MPMEVANGRVVLNKYGSDTPVFDLTPAEAIVLHVLHGPSNGGRTFGEEFTKINVVGTAKVATGKTKTVVVQEAVPEKVVKGKLIKPATPEQIVPGDVIEPAKPEQVIPAKDGKPEVRIPAQPEKRAPGYLIPAQAAVYEPDVITPAQPAVTKEEPILVDRTNAQELARLRRKYGQAKNKKGELIIDSIWTDKLNPSLPATFKEINWQQIGEAAASPDLQPAALNYVTESLLRTE